VYSYVFPKPDFDFPLLDLNGGLPSQILRNCVFQSKNFHTLKKERIQLPSYFKYGKNCHGNEEIKIRSYTEFTI